MENSTNARTAEVQTNRPGRWLSTLEQHVWDVLTGEPLYCKQIARRLNRSNDAELKGVLKNLVAREVLSHKRGIGYQRAGVAALASLRRLELIAAPEEDDEDGQDASLSTADLVERIAAARAEKAATNGHTIGDLDREEG